jgi:O-antigen ligase
MSAAFDIPVLQRMTLTPMRWFVVLVGLSVPITVALDNVLLALVLLGAVFSLGSIARVTVSHPVARAAMLLFSMLLVAMFYGATPLKDAFAILGKYVDLMFIPIFIFLLAHETSRRRARYAYLAAMALILALSFLVGLKLMPVMSWMHQYAESGNPAIFHSHITQNNMMAFAVLLALLECRNAATLAKRFAWGAFGLLGSINVLFMVQGRTGYLILLALLGWFVWTSLTRYMRKRGKDWGWRQGVLVLFALAVLAFTAYQTSARLHDRVAQVLSDFQAWTPDHGKLTSTGQRLDFYSNTLQIVEEHALLGVGTGGFPDAFAQQIQGKDVMATQNPHNEYLMVSVQTGVFGLALLLYLFYTQWRYAPLLPTSLEQDAARGLVLMYMVNCMLNSALHDHADGLFFAFMVATLFAGLKRETQHG